MRIQLNDGVRLALVASTTSVVAAGLIAAGIPPSEGSELLVFTGGVIGLISFCTAIVAWWKLMHWDSSIVIVEPEPDEAGARIEADVDAEIARAV